MKVRLPDPVYLCCPSCSFTLQLAPAAAGELEQLTCPRCASAHPTYYWLPPGARLELSARIRSRLYFEAHRLNTGDSATRDRE